MASLWARGMYSDHPPAMQTRDQINPTLMMSWWATGFSLAIIIVRLCGRYIRIERFFPEDKVVMISVIPLVIRMVLVHFVLVLGTNNTTTGSLTEQDIRNRELGSKLVLAARIFYAIFIWTAKVTVCEFLKRVTGLVWRRSVALFLRFINFFLISTLVAVVIATLAECQPFDHYWQVVPDPGPTCRTGYVNLITMGTCDVITDLLLIAFPVPIIMLAQMPLKRKLALIILFCLSLFLVAITCYRVPSVIGHKGSQQYRSLLASLEILAATAVSNAVVIGSFVRDRGVKKLKYKRDQGSASVSESMDKSFVRRNTVMQNQWGSDSDLATGLCIRLDPDMVISPTTTADGSLIPRPAPPVALPPHMPLAVARTGSIDPSWSFTTTRSDDDHASATDSLDIKISPREYLRTNTSPRESIAHPRRVSFSDVGGLLTRALPGDSLARSENSRENSNPASARPAPPAEASQRRSGSRGFLEDLGIVTPFSSRGAGLGRSQALPHPQPRPSLHSHSQSYSHNLTRTHTNTHTHTLPAYRSSSDITLDEDVELQDVGGLLSTQHQNHGRGHDIC
ncbi:uncharacterized protein N7511_004928 [Penicillium nucicola]|uniref:uncharacterized protein n=1 Tax=Penicillium nucicola TaxID=1850975 RepID=UPI002544E72B|nr:uncharacterized protein N7511_004928 [Penicillium nucicola]KAJ5767312.1 hypothetical protein N7511_004928 [Penicillium nucicola]